MELTRLFVALLCVLVLLVSCTDARKRKSRRSKRNHKTCRPKTLVRYEMTVKTTWDRDTFPKMYPTYRPPAHWSQLVGRSHGTKYRMWQEGANASRAVQEFAEHENGEYLNLELAQGYSDVFDAFVAPNIQQGVGETSAVISVDGGHSKVSLMMKIVPSPDWFVGIDSVDLCYRGRWKKKLSRDLRPFDAGTDQGRTFTSPNWPNDPREPISAITSSSPDHPASSFFYPDYKVLPRLAYVEFEMVSEYRLRKVHKQIKHLVRPVNEIDIIPKKSTTSGDNNVPNGAISPQDVFLRGNSRDQVLSQVSSPLGSQPSNHHSGTGGGGVRTYPGTPQLHGFGVAPEMRNLGTARTDTETAKVTQESSKLKEYAQRVDCQVSEWAEWSPCSQTCGFGTKQRSRVATILPKDGGANCPLLKEESVCGSMRNCKWQHFSLMGSNSKDARSPFRTTRRRRIRRRRKH